MGRMTIPFAFLTEHLNDEGEPILSGRFGAAMIVGRINGLTDDGKPIWALAVTEGERARERREHYRRRKGATGG